MMRLLFLIVLLFSGISYCQDSGTDQQEFFLSVSPAVDQNNENNRLILRSLSIFLRDSNRNQWLNKDFETFKSPYADLFQISPGKNGEFSYQPSVMEIIETDDSQEKLVKIAFIGTNDPQNKNYLVKAIYNVIAVRTLRGVLFKNVMPYFTRNWLKAGKGSVYYYYPPGKSLNQQEMSRQHTDNLKLAQFFETHPLQISYYSARNPQEVFQIKGFDYHPMMFVDTSGGFAVDYNIVLSANNSEYYLHEVAHLYTSKLFPDIVSLLDEGFATYVGGSGKFNYAWQREKLQRFLAENPDFDISKHLDPYERIYFEDETPVPYLIGALICERILRLHGKQKLMDLMKSGLSLAEILPQVGLTDNNINTELRSEITRNMYDVFKN